MFREQLVISLPF